MVVAIVGLRDTAHAVPDYLCAVLGYGLAASVVGVKQPPFFSGWEPPKILYGGWQLMI